MLGQVVRNLCRNRGGRTLVASAIGVLAAAQVWLSVPASKPSRETKPMPAMPVQPRIKITQTRSELGYVYWVVREVGGSSPRYALFDTWREAMQEATRRVSQAQGEAVFVGA